MTRRGQILLFFIILCITAPAFAQTTPDPKIQALEQKLDELLRQATALRQELDALKGVQPEADTDLTKVDVVPTTPAPAPTAQAAEAASNEPPASALTDVQTVNNPSNTAASKVFNPDTSVIGNFLGHAGRDNPFEGGGRFLGGLPGTVRPEGDPRNALALDEAEVAFEAFVDPYAKAKFFLSGSPDGFEVEEGYANFVNLPYDITAKVGKFKGAFGKVNTWHPHQAPWVDQPLVIHNFFGPEGLNGSGISVSKIFPNRFNTFIEGTVEVMDGNNTVFNRDKTSDLTYLGHLKAFHDLTENSNVEVGASLVTGKTVHLTPDPVFPDLVRRDVAGIDLTYRWKPLMQGLYRSLIARTEAYWGDTDQSSRMFGFYSSLDYQLGQRWFTGVRIDSSDAMPFLSNPAFGATTVVDNATDRGVSATITFWPSEFSQLRGQFRRTRYGFVDKTFNEILFQLQFAIGAHGAHTF
ncbi:MAG TPA: hypothetical protein VGR02_03910 [Thermoanaerobaculia bacterium]|jgi:hypothetical protein|nr:hypothetical protein [Thermoanaerobaculia bacterium]